MKQNLNPVTVYVVLGIVALAVGVGLFLYFKPSVGQGPPLKPKPWSPPGAWSGAPGTGTPGAGAPAGQGAPTGQSAPSGS